MLKVGSKRRRPAAQIKAEKEMKATQEVDFESKMAELKAFEAHIDRKKNELQNGLNAEGILSDLIKTGEIKEHPDGSWGAVRDFEHKPI